MRPIELLSCFFLAWCSVFAVTHDLVTAWKTTTRQVPGSGLIARFMLYQIIGLGIGFTAGFLSAGAPP